MDFLRIYPSLIFEIPQDISRITDVWMTISSEISTRRHLWTDTMWPAKCLSEIISKLNMKDVITYVLPGQSLRVVTGLVKWWNGKKENE
jgi:hypothetical protein